MSYVCNCKVEFIRKKGYQNLADWCNDPNNVYIGRRGIVFIEGQRFPKEDSFFANPYKVGKDGDLEQVLKKYYDYITNKPEVVTKLREIKGKNLGCWCVETNQMYHITCHGQVLLFLMQYV